MDLILWRHAHAEEGSPDLLRPLSDEGRRQALLTAQWLKARLPRHVTMLVSPARRTQQTAQALEMDFRTCDALAPGASAEAVLKAVGWPDRGGTVIVVGHQPTLGHVAAQLLTGRPAGWHVDKSGVWWLTGEINRTDTHAETALRAVMPPALLK